MTCKDLTDIFKHVYQIKGGGIIVLEDIDRMTDIVLSDHQQDRLDQQQDISVTDIKDIEDSPLNASCILTILDGVLTQDGSTVIVTTNHPERLDEAFKRPGRFDLTVELRNACHDQIKMIGRKFLGKDPHPDILAQIEEYKWSPAEIIYRLKDFVLDVEASDNIIFEPFLKASPYHP